MIYSEGIKAFNSSFYVFPQHTKKGLSLCAYTRIYTRHKTKQVFVGRATTW